MKRKAIKLGTLLLALVGLSACVSEEPGSIPVSGDDPVVSSEASQDVDRPGSSEVDDPVSSDVSSEIEDPVVSTDSSVVEEHVHTFSDEWMYDETHHWHAATCEHTSEVSGRAEHVWDDGVTTTPSTCLDDGLKTYTCTVCGATKTENIPATGHTFSSEWSYDEMGHWHASTCGHDLTSEYGDHDFVDGACTVCDMPMPVSPGLVFTPINDGTAYEVAWDTVTYLRYVYVPSEYEGLPVTKLARNAFHTLESLQYAYIPDSVTELGARSFRSCYSLEKVRLPGGISSIPESTFESCFLLEGIVIPDSVKSIGQMAFAYCSAIKEIVFPEGVESLGIMTFMGCVGLEKAILPSTVSSIDIGLFANCNALSSIEISEDNPVYHVDGNCIIKTGTGELVAGCKDSLIPDDGSVTSIGTGAFYSLESLRHIEIPNAVTSIATGAFGDCYYLNEVVIPDGVTSIGSLAFSSCYNLSRVSLGIGLTSIASDAFQDCHGIVEVCNRSALDITAGSSDGGGVARYALNVCVDEARSKLSDEGDYRFYHDETSSYLVSYLGSESDIVLPSSFTSNDGTEVTSYSIYQYAFERNEIPVRITLPDAVVGIDYAAFYDCSSLFEIVIGDGVTSIGRYAFYGCTSLTKVTLGSGLTSVDPYAFYMCSDLIEVYNRSPFDVGSGGLLNASLWNVYTEEGGSLLTETEDGFLFYGDGPGAQLIRYLGDGGDIVLPSSFTREDGTIVDSYVIADDTFLLNDEITSVEIPGSVTEIGIDAFRNCIRLLRLEMADGVRIVGSGVFSGCSSLEEVRLPSSLTSLGPNAFTDCARIESLVLSDTLIDIGTEAFNRCLSMDAIYYEGSLEQWEAIEKGARPFNECPAVLYTYSEAEPVEEGPYWHYDEDGNPIIW